ncbi:MAG: hypothetical protein HQ569_01190, partial [Actinobacteria bacterium]|nr:hypothetical protein [Actinomycetota bacterium]
TSNSGDCCSNCGDCDGGWYMLAFKYIQEKGVATEQCFPDTGKYTGKTISCNLCSNYLTKFYTITSYDSVPATIEAVKRALVCKGPLSVGSNNWHHAIVLVGYNDETQNWIIKNSWGRLMYSPPDGYGAIPYYGHRYSDIINRAYYVEGVVKK